MTDYQTVARAVRGPMRKWWRRVGVWWIVLAAALVVYFLAAAVYNVLSNATGVQVPTWIRLAYSSHWITITLASYAWIAAILRLNAVLDNLATGTPEQQPGSRFVSYRFRLGLLQGIPSIIIINIYGFAFNFYYSPFAYNTAGEAITSVAALLTGGACRVAAPAIGLAYIAALLALNSQHRVIAWFLWFAMIAFNGVFNLLFFFSLEFGFPSVTYPVVGQTGSDDSSITIALWLLGTVLSLLTLWVLARGNPRLGQRLLIVLTGLLLVQQTRIGCASHMETSMFELRFVVDSVLAYLQYIPLFAPILWLHMHSALHWNLAGAAGTCDFAAWQALPVIVLQAGSVLGHFFLLHWIITPRATIPASPPGLPAAGD